MIETNYYNERSHMSFFDQSFSNPRCIGKGSFGSKDDKRWYAIKITVEPFRNSSDRDDKLREVKKHELLPKHPNIISYVRAWEEYGFYIYKRSCANTGAFIGLQDESGSYYREGFMAFFSDIALALRYLHSRELLHLDIKPQNIMISFDGICKLGDFSLIIDLNKDSREDEGDGKYLAPEVLQNGGDKPSDMFSFGMTIIDICTDFELPRTGDLWQGFRCKKIYHEFIKDVPPALLDIILCLLETDPSKRPTAEEICCIPMVAKSIHERQYKYLELNIWWILLTIGYSSLFASSWITSDESPMFKHGIVPRVSDSSRLELKFEEDDDDYEYNDTETDSSDKMEMSQSEDELINVMETSISEEPHFDEIGKNSRIDINTPSPSSLESVCEFEQISNSADSCGGDTIGLTDLFHNKATFYEFGAGDVFERSDYDIFLGEEIPNGKTFRKENEFMPENSESRQDIFVCDTLEFEDHELPSTSGSVSDRPKSPEPPENEISSLHDGYITPPSSITPSFFVCKTPERGRFDDSAEQRLRHYYWWRESFRSPTRRIYAEGTGAFGNDISHETMDEKQLSDESSPPAKRAQTGDEEDTGNSEDQIADPQIKKSDTDAE
ncbi:hypothetical protein DINM_006049 [Dirofilaria immitis]|nr:hypothetical protein [Dirofilaria immitis]